MRNCNLIYFIFASKNRGSGTHSNGHNTGCAYPNLFHRFIVVVSVTLFVSVRRIRQMYLVYAPRWRILF